MKKFSCVIALSLVCVPSSFAFNWFTVSMPETDTRFNVAEGYGAFFFGGIVPLMGTFKMDLPLLKDLSAASRQLLSTESRERRIEDAKSRRTTGIILVGGGIAVGLLAVVVDSSALQVVCGTGGAALSIFGGYFWLDGTIQLRTLEASE